MTRCHFLFSYLAEGRPRADELEDDSVSVLLDPRRDGAVHHDGPESIAPASDVVHHHLVRGQLVLDGFAGHQVVVVAHLARFQFDADPQLTDHLHP